MISAVFAISWLLFISTEAERPVFPLIIDGLAPNGVRLNDAPKNRVYIILSANSQYIKTSGISKSCKRHIDCYALREPNEWCPLPTTDKYYDKGCFCDPSRNQCIIERQGANGSEYTDCTDKAISKCIETSQIQFSEPDISNNTILDKSRTIDHLAVSPESVYVQTSAKSKSCKRQDDCYSMREPDEWCPLPPTDRYYEKGCFCNSRSQSCAIERQTTNGSEYSDCAEKSTSKCQANNRQYSDIQKFPAPSVQKNITDKKWPEHLNWLTVSSKGRYVPTSGHAIPCLQHSECYAMREPNEWCPLPPTDRYYEKGCFCDYDRAVCAIEREVPGGSEYTDCAEKTSSTC